MWFRQTRERTPPGTTHIANPPWRTFKYFKNTIHGWMAWQWNPNIKDFGWMGYYHNDNTPTGLEKI